MTCRTLRTGLDHSLCKARHPRSCPELKQRTQVLLLMVKMPTSRLQTSHSPLRRAREGQRIKPIEASSPVRSAKMQGRVNKRQLKPAKMETGDRRTRQSSRVQERKLTPKMELTSQPLSKSAKEPTSQGRPSRIPRLRQQAKETSRPQANLRTEASSLEESLVLSHLKPSCSAVLLALLSVLRAPCRQTRATRLLRERSRRVRTRGLSMVGRVGSEAS